MRHCSYLETYDIHTIGPSTYNTARSEPNGPALASLKQQASCFLIINSISPSTKRLSLQLKTLQTQLTRLEKERAKDAEKHESRITQAEARTQDLVKEKLSMQGELATFEKERRKLGS